MKSTVSRFSTLNRRAEYLKLKEKEKLAKECVESPKEKFKNENEIANYMKKFLEDKYKDKDLCWHVIIGRNFGGCITFKEKVMCYFYVGQVGFLVFVY